MRIQIDVSRCTLHACDASRADRVVKCDCAVPPLARSSVEQSDMYGWFQTIPRLCFKKSHRKLAAVSFRRPACNRHVKKIGRELPHIVNVVFAQEFPQSWRFVEG